MRTVVQLGALLAGLTAVGCGPADVGGNYTINVTNGDNGCEISTWTVGESATGIPLVVMQSDDQVQLDVNGASGTALDLLVGSSIFNGQVSGNGVTGALIGSRSYNQGMCAFTYTVDVDANVDGDFIEGQLAYRPVTNNHPDCGVLDTCRNLQSFNGTRPPP